jgi:hypothetical protein
MKGAQNMKLKLKEKQLPPMQLRLVLPATLKDLLDRYVTFVRDASGREVEAREIAVEMLAQFMESDRDFKQWQRQEERRVVEPGLRKGQRAVEVNGQGAG